jgi:L-seryl-tRNA(Ser) seleniumtransferase
MKVHTSNYVVEGFTSEVPDEQLSELCRAHGVPFVNDLGSGTLLDLSSYGLPKEETVAESLARGADLVTFSGDKLLGGPQCGIIAGKAELIARIKKNALKRALRVDKLTMAALGAVLKLYADPARVIQKVPALRLLTRSRADILAVARRISGPLQTILGPDYSVEVTEMKSQIGSGAMPIDLLPSAGLRIGPKKKNSRMLRKIISSFRQLPKPVVGRVNDDALVLDLRCLELETEFLQQLSLLKIARES